MAAPERSRSLCVLQSEGTDRVARPAQPGYVHGGNAARR